MNATGPMLIVAAALSAVSALGAPDGRLRTVEYSADEIYRLRGQVGFQIDVQFESGETFVGLGAGDLAGIAFFSQDNHLFIKPKAALVVTNVTVLTNRRHYQFDYSTVGHGEKIMYALRFSYPPEPAKAGAAAARQVDASLATRAPERIHNSDYWYCGAESLMPVAAWDDGVHTRLRFAARAEQPAVFVRNDDDSESLLNFSMDGEEVVVQRVAHRFVLRRGALTGCIVNKGFLGAGDRLESGTVSGAVERVLSGGTP
jgi:type IV secretion system protein VirB9